MIKKLYFIKISMIFIILLSTLHVVYAAPPVFYGFFDSYRGNTLTVRDKQGNKVTYSVSKSTLIANIEGTKQRLERLRSGTRVSVTAQNDKAVQIVIKEVPK